MKSKHNLYIAIEGTLTCLVFVGAAFFAPSWLAAFFFACGGVFFFAAVHFYKRYKETQDID